MNNFEEELRSLGKQFHAFIATQEWRRKRAVTLAIGILALSWLVFKIAGSVAGFTFLLIWFVGGIVAYFLLCARDKRAIYNFCKQNIDGLKYRAHQVVDFLELAEENVSKMATVAYNGVQEDIHLVEKLLIEAKAECERLKKVVLMIDQMIQSNVSGVELAKQCILLSQISETVSNCQKELAKKIVGLRQNLEENFQA